MVFVDIGRKGVKMKEINDIPVIAQKTAKAALWRARGMNTLFNRINRDVDIMGGKACIKGTRVTVGMIVTQISEGKTAEDVVREYPYLSLEDISEALRYAAWSVESREAEIQTA